MWYIFKIFYISSLFLFELKIKKDFGISEEEMMDRAISDSLNAKMSQMRIKTR